MATVFNTVASHEAFVRGNVNFAVADIEEAKDMVKAWGRGGCHAVLEACTPCPPLSQYSTHPRPQVVGNPSALTLGLALLAPTGVLSSCGVQQAPPLPFTGREMYNTNATLEFGRCSVRALLPAAARLLLARADVLGARGKGAVIERIIPLRDAPTAYARFETGEWGKVVFDPWA